MLVMSFCYGATGTIETFVSQSYGAKSFYMCGVQLNRGRIISTCFFVPLALLMHYSDVILILVGQDADISVMARNYIVWILPGCFMSIQFEARKRFLQSI